MRSSGDVFNYSFVDDSYGKLLRTRTTAIATCGSWCHMVTSATTSTIIPTDDISPGTGVSDYACLVDHSGDVIDHYYSFIYHSYGRKRSPYTVFAGACLVTHSGDGFYINVNFSYGRTIAELDQFRLRVYSPPFWLRPLRLLLGRPFLRRLV